MSLYSSTFHVANVKIMLDVYDDGEAWLNVMSDERGVGVRLKASEIGQLIKHLADARDRIPAND